MISDVEIKKTLSDLDIRYTSALKDLDLSIYLSKLALLELCGWLECEMDSMIETYLSANLKYPRNINDFKIRIIDKTYGFNYDSHFRPMLMGIVGISYLESIEDDLGADIEVLRADLKTLMGMRNNAAHTYILGTTVTYTTPSAMLTMLKRIHPILNKIEGLI